jgi:hypothetical protein
MTIPQTLPFYNPVRDTLSNTCPLQHSCERPQYEKFMLTRADYSLLCMTALRPPQTGHFDTSQRHYSLLCMTIPQTLPFHNPVR